MYSKEERLKAVELLIQYDMMYSVVIRELGYPYINSLRKWYREYIRNGDVHDCCTRKSKYTSADKQYAVNYYLEHGKCVSRTCKKLGYPSRSVLNAWIEELAPQQKKHCASGGRNVEYTQEQKQSAVIDMCSRTGSVAQVAEKHGVTQPTLYKWKKELLKENSILPMKKKEHTTNIDLMQENEKLMKERDELRKEVYQLQLEKDILEKAAEIIKKDRGITLDSLANCEKAIVIDALRDQYTLKELLIAFHMAKSSYCYQMAVFRAPDKYEGT